MRALVPALLAVALAGPALAQPRIPGGDASPRSALPAQPEVEEPAPPPGRSADSLQAEYCTFLRSQVSQAEQTLRQTATTLNAIGRTAQAGQVATQAALMDHWTGRFSALVEASAPLSCYDAATLEQARGIAAQYAAFAAQARDFAMRAAVPAPQQAAAPGQQQAMTPAQRRREQRLQQQREQEMQQSLLP